MNTFAILDIKHIEYHSIILAQTTAFQKIQAHSNFVPIINLLGTQALISLFTPLPVSSCVISQGMEEVPASRIMTEWQKPVII